MLIKSLARAVIKRIWAFAADFIEAVAVFCALVAKGLHELARVKMPSSLAKIVNPKSVSPFWTVKYVKCGQSTEKYVVKDVAHDIFLARRTAGDVYDRF